MQGLDGLKPGNVFGDKGLVACAQQELLVQLPLEDRSHDEAGHRNDAENAHGDAAEHNAVPQHDAQADQQERQVPTTVRTRQMVVPRAGHCSALAACFHSLEFGRNVT